MTTLDDFFGDGTDNAPECSFCGGADGELIVSVEDHNGPTHWHHKTCKIEAEVGLPIAITPTWDEAMDKE